MIGKVRWLSVGYRRAVAVGKEDEQGAADNAEPSTTWPRPHFVEISTTTSVSQAAGAYLSSTTHVLVMTADMSGRPGRVGFGTPERILRHYMRRSKDDRA